MVVRCRGMCLLTILTSKLSPEAPWVMEWTEWTKMKFFLKLVGLLNLKITRQAERENSRNACLEGRLDVKIVSKHIPLHRKTISSTLKLLKQTEMTVSKCLKNRIIWFHNLGFIFWSLELGRFYRVKVQTQLAFLTINFARARRAWTRYHIRWHIAAHPLWTQL